jgi:hypothetical protein
MISDTDFATAEESPCLERFSAVANVLSITTMAIMSNRRQQKPENVQMREAQRSDWELARELPIMARRRSSSAAVRGRIYLSSRTSRQRTECLQTGRSPYTGVRRLMPTKKYGDQVCCYWNI